MYVVCVTGEDPLDLAVAMKKNSMSQENIKNLKTSTRILVKYRETYNGDFWYNRKQWIQKYKPPPPHGYMLFYISFFFVLFVTSHKLC